MIRIVIADDHVLLLQGLAQALDSLPDIEVIGTAADGNRLLELIETTQPTVVVTDIEMPGLTGVDILEKLEQPPPTIMVTMHTDPAYRDRADRAGAVGFLSKSSPLPLVAAAIRAAAAGESFVHSGQVDALLERFGVPAVEDGGSGLTDREREVLEALASGITGTGDLAHHLFISNKTVKNHLASIYAKLGVNDRAAAVLEALRLGLVRNGSSGP